MGISEEKRHLSSALSLRNSPIRLWRTSQNPRTRHLIKEPTADIKSTAVLPYIKRLCEPLRRCLQQHGIGHRIAEGAVDPRKKDGVVYKIPCECGRVCICETGRGMHAVCMHGLRIYDFPELKPQPFLNTPIRPGIIHFRTRLNLLTETLTGTLIGF